MILANILLQGTVATGVEKEMTMSLIDLYFAGGWVMHVISVLSLVALYIFTERFLVIGKATKVDNNFMNRIKDYMYEGKVDAALQLCRSTKYSTGPDDRERHHPSGKASGRCHGGN